MFLKVFSKAREWDKSHAGSRLLQQIFIKNDDSNMVKVDQLCPFPTIAYNYILYLFDRMEISGVEWLLLVEVNAVTVVPPTVPVIATHIPMDEATLVLPLQALALLPVTASLMDLATMLFMGYRGDRERKKILGQI